MLQEFINEKLLRITDEENFDKLKRTSSAIVKKLNKNQAKIVSYTLIALDPEISANNPEVIEVKELIIKNWRTFLSISKDTPKTYIRAVVLEALEILSKEAKFACLIWLTGRNIYKHFKLIGKEAKLIEDFMLNIGKALNDIALNSWSPRPVVEVKDLAVEIETLPGVSVDRTTLQKKLVHASGPTDEGGIVPYQNPTIHWPSSGATWVHQFVPRAAKSISDIVDKALKEQTNNISSFQTQFIEAISKTIAEIQSELIERNSLMQVRTQLLWWKESCYSLSLNQSYRGLANGLLQVLMAKDYSNYIPEVHPISVDYFLMETHRQLNSDDDSKLKISDVLKLIEQSGDELKPILMEPTTERGRMSLISFIIGLVQGKYSVKQFKNLVGISINSEISWSEFTLWSFYDFLVIKSLQTK